MFIVKITYTLTLSEEKKIQIQRYCLVTRASPFSRLALNINRHPENQSDSFSGSEHTIAIAVPNVGTKIRKKVLAGIECNCTFLS